MALLQARSNVAHKKNDGDDTSRESSSQEGEKSPSLPLDASLDCRLGKSVYESTKNSKIKRLVADLLSLSGDEVRAHRAESHARSSPSLVL